MKRTCRIHTWTSDDGWRFRADALELDGNPLELIASIPPIDVNTFDISWWSGNGLVVVLSRWSQSPQTVVVIDGNSRNALKTSEREPGRGPNDTDLPNDASGAMAMHNSVMMHLGYLVE